MKKFILIISAVIFSIATIEAAGNADKTLAEVSKKITSSKSMQVWFSITADGTSSNGQLLMAGNRFYIDTSQMSAWFNGKTQWTLNKQDKEVNITEPEGDELQQINPLLVLKEFQTHYNAELLKSAGVTKSVRLTPKNKKGSISKAVINISNSTGYPESIILTLSNGHAISLKFKKIKAGGAVNGSVFNFNPNKYRGYEIIDLR